MPATALLHPDSTAYLNYPGDNNFPGTNNFPGATAAPANSVAYAELANDAQVATLTGNGVNFSTVSAVYALAELQLT